MDRRSLGKEISTRVLRAAFAHRGAITIVATTITLVLASGGCIRDRSTALVFTPGECPEGTALREERLEDNSRRQWCERSLPNKEPEKHGPFVTWHPNGNMAGLGSFFEGEEHGPFTLWYENGQKSQQGEFRHGLPHGRWTAWLEDGTRVYIMDFRDGEIVCGEDPLQPRCD